MDGHTLFIGRDAGVMKNPLWKIESCGEVSLVMYCEKETLVNLCLQSYQKIVDFERNQNGGKKMTWFKHVSGYIACTANSIYMHQIIMDCYGNGKGTHVISVDHIDQNPLNNQLSNLRIATRK